MTFRWNTSKRNGPGYVYLFQAIDGLYKIGASRKPRIRLMSFQNPTIAAKLIHQIPTEHMYPLERWIHKRYSSLRVTGEWFALTDQEVREFCSWSVDPNPLKVPPPQPAEPLALRLFELVEKRPFVPFRIILSDATIVISDPNIIRIGIHHLALFDMSPLNPKLFAACETMMLFHIKRIELLSREQVDECRAHYLTQEP